MSADREKIIEKLQKVKSLADRGARGEREAAEQLLERLLLKYGMTEEDLGTQKVSSHFLRYKTEFEKKLIHQLAYCRLGSGHSFGTMGTYTGRARKMVCIKCTAAAFLEITADFEFYRVALAEEMSCFYEAFLAKNDLFPPPELATPEEERQAMDPKRFAKIMQMANGVDFVQRAPQIEAAKEKAASAATETARK